MFPQQPQQQFRTAGADVQIFYGSGAVANCSFGWTKPIGVSHIYMLLIGGGADGDGTNGGGSGAVAVWYGAAQNIPNVLQLLISTGGSSIRTISGSSTISLITANASTTVTGASATTANQFTALGFFQSVKGQDGSPGDPGASTTTFLSGGGASGLTTANYGYTASISKAGYFMLQPMIVGVGGAGGGTSVGGIGCGGALSGKGGPGMVLIASW